MFETQVIVVNIFFFFLTYQYHSFKQIFLHSYLYFRIIKLNHINFYFHLKYVFLNTFGDFLPQKKKKTLILMTTNFWIETQNLNSFELYYWMLANSVSLYRWSAGLKDVINSAVSYKLHCIDTHTHAYTLIRTLTHTYTSTIIVEL